MSIESERVNAYAKTIARLEPEIAMIDDDAANASIAISLKRIADALEGMTKAAAEIEVTPIMLAAGRYEMDKRHDHGNVLSRVYHAMRRLEPGL